MVAKRVKVGIIGCGEISWFYLKNMTKLKVLEVTTLSDIDEVKAKKRADEYKIPTISTVEEMLLDPEIKIVVNLTIPKVHCDVSLKIINAGKSVYSEKPLGINRDEGRRILEAAKKKNVLVGCAPDTFMGASWQTARKLIDDGKIGKVFGFNAFFQGHAPETVPHPNPQFLYEEGAGPMFDMGPYYITCLVNLLGPVKRVASLAKKPMLEKKIIDGPKKGETLKVKTPSHINGMLEFTGGACGNVMFTFDAVKSETPRIEIYGTEGALLLSDPNKYGDEIKICKGWGSAWEPVKLEHEHREEYRGLGVADMAYSMESGRKRRATGELGYHVLDVMCTILDADGKGFVDLKSTVERPEMIPAGLPINVLDE